MPFSRQNPDRNQTRAEIQAAYRQRQKQAMQEQLKQKGLPAAPLIPTIPAAPRWTALLAAARANIETARDEMQAYFDDRSEVWQESERGEAMQERIEQLENTLDTLPTD